MNKKQAKQAMRETLIFMQDGFRRATKVDHGILTGILGEGEAYFQKMLNGFEPDSETVQPEENPNIDCWKEYTASDNWETKKDIEEAVEKLKHTQSYQCLASIKVGKLKVGKLLDTTAYYYKVDYGSDGPSDFILSEGKDSRAEINSAMMDLYDVNVVGEEFYTLKDKASILKCVGAKPLVLTYDMDRNDIDKLLRHSDDRIRVFTI